MPRSSGSYSGLSHGHSVRCTRSVGHMAAATSMSCRSAIASRGSVRRFRVIGTSRITVVDARGTYHCSARPIRALHNRSKISSTLWQA
uniref:Uncharacterized protein n=1 Tax=Arundo donax TaxID=35708 RepID=A0A0A9DHZ7_ARUDO